MSYSIPYRTPYRSYPGPVVQPKADALTIKETILYSALGLAMAGGAYFLIRREIVKSRAKSEQNKTMDEGGIATYAKQIMMAFENDGWWGTDKDALRQVIRDIPTKNDFKKVMVSYNKLYNSNMLQDMQSELKSTEYNEMLAIVSAKPESGAGSTQSLSLRASEWAKRLKAAFDIHYGPFPGTDEEAIKAVFVEVPTQTAYQLVGTEYKRLFGTDLAEDLQSELEFWEYDGMMQIILSKPKT